MVPLTTAGSPPRPSTRRRISSWSMVAFALPVTLLVRPFATRHLRSGLTNAPRMPGSVLRLGSSPCRQDPIGGQRIREYFIRGVDEDKPKPLAHLGGDIFHVALVLSGEHHGLDPAPMGGQNLFADPAHRQDFPTQRDLAGHGHLRS